LYIQLCVEVIFIMSYFSFQQGKTPLLISMPHIGQTIPENIVPLMTSEALLMKDTDWYVDLLYDFAAELGASVIKPEISRYVIDLNRGTDGVNLYPGANSTELCPTSAFNLSSLYKEGAVLSEQDVKERISAYWMPYHQQIEQALAAIKAEFGYAILLDAHSILSKVPRFFEGQLPDFNFGTANGVSCSPSVLEAVLAVNYQQYSVVNNQRFKGGYITRQYGDPDNHIHAIQLELSQRTYMNEQAFTYNDERANNVKPFLKNIVQALIDCTPETLNQKS